MTTTLPATQHGTAIALGDAAALIRGPSGSGKSDLALRCLAVPVGGLIGEPVRLVADDRAVLTRDGGDILVSAPPAIAGRIEVRGLGIVEVPSVAAARLRLVVDLVPPDALERMPEDHHCLIEGVQVQRLALAPFEGSAALKLLLCLRGVKARNL